MSFFSQQERVRCSCHKTEVARLFWLVLKGKLNIRRCFCHLGDVFKKPAALLDKVGLKRIVIPVLARPQVDDLTAKSSSHFDTFKGVINCLLAGVFILGGEATSPPTLLAEVVGDNRNTLKVVLVE